MASPEDIARLAHLEAAFAEAGGRGVEMAEEIDALRRRIGGIDEQVKVCPNCGGPEGYPKGSGGHAVGCIHGPSGPDPIELGIKGD